MLLQRFLVICIYAFFCILIHAQHHLVFTPIDCKNGLSENRVRNIEQLNDGRMVITTEGVTNIYDGTSFKHLHLKETDVCKLSGYRGFHHGYVDKDYIWMKNDGRLILMDIQHECFVAKPDSVLASMGISEPIADFFMDNDNNYWILTASDKLMYRNTRSGKTTVFLHNASEPIGANDELQDVAVAQGYLFLFYRSSLMVCYDLKTSRKEYQTYYFSKQDQLLQNSSTLMVVQSKNSLYLLRNGLFGVMLEYNIQKREWATVLKTNDWLNTISVDTNENLWVTCRSGLWRVDKSLLSKQLVSTFVMVDGTEIKTEASTIYNDSQGGVWIGTFNRGLLYYHADRFKFKNIGKTFFGSDVNDIDVTCFTETEQGSIVVGTSKGLYSYAPETSSLSLWKGLPADIGCVSLTRDSKGRIWLSSWNYGLYCIENNIATKFDLGGLNVLGVVEAVSGQLYFATNWNGFGTFNPETGQYQRIQTSQVSQQQPGSVLQLIRFDSQSLLGIGNNGLFVFDYKRNELKQAQTVMLSSGNQKFNSIYRDSRGIIWIGTQDGLNVWMPHRNEIQTLYTDDGLVNNSIKGILEDKQGLIWITTAGGVSRIDVEDNAKVLQFSISNFNYIDGVIGNEFSTNATYASSNGLLLMGGINGFNVIDLHKPWMFKRLQKPLFTNFMLAGVAVKPNVSYEGNLILKQSISTTLKVQLRYNQNFIGIEFSALNYVNPTQTYYQYKLEGVDNEWREIVASNGTGNATYTNLAPGTYVFKVKAANNSKEWNNEVASMTILVKPPFWKTAIAYLIYLALVLLLLYLLMAYYKKRTHERLVRKNEEKLNQMKFSFFTNVSHEFRTPLTLILTPLESLLKEIKDTALESRIRLIYRHARDLQNLVNQLLDFRRLEISGEKLNLTFGDVVEFVQQFDDLFAKLAEDKNIGFSVIADAPEIYMYFDKDKLYKIINNLLSNSFKFSSQGGSVIVHLSHTVEHGKQGFVQIDVQDCGSGIPEADLLNIFNRFYQSHSTQGGSGIGLHLVREYVKLHSGEITVESQPNIRTVFKVVIPDNLVPVKVDSEDHVVMLESVAEEKSTVALAKQRLLVVEDNDDLRGFLVAELSRNYKVIEASDGEDAEKLAHSMMPDLIVSDVLMPKMDGLELCKRIKTDLNTSHIPVILLTARSTEEHKIAGYHAGADEYLSKPFNLDILLLRIEKLIEQQNHRKEKFSQKIEVNPREITITSLDEQLIQKALDCIEKNMDNPDYSVQQFSQDMGMDRTVLYKKLQSITGLAPSDFMRSIRLKRAAQFLIQGQYPVAEVAEKVGFNTPKYFSKYFKEAFGVTPSQYAQNAAKQAE